MRALLAAVLLAGCYKPVAEGSCEVSCNAASPACPGSLQCIDNLCRDPADPSCTATDAGSDGPAIVDAPRCYGGGFFDPICPETPPTSVLTLVGSNAVSTDGTICTEVVMRLGIELCVVIADSISIPQVARFTGTRPIVLLATSTINIGGVVDVSSTSMLAPGAAANRNCSMPQPGGSTMIDNGGAGGGAGGSYATLGGNGGDGANASGAEAAGTRAVEPLGGCAGGLGGNGRLGGAGIGGAGGGAAILIAGQMIQITGGVDAYGAGGFGATAESAGGGGGGSGGLIVLEAPTLSGQGRLLAGGGGGGAGGTDATGGGTGAEMDSVVPDIGAFGGSAGSGAGGGGMGAINGPGGPGGLGVTYGGGGGGGGAGYIKLYTATNGLTGPIAPLPTN